MLEHLYIENFTLIDRLDLDWKAGMTTITGETGAGKSIILEAMGLMLGGRADATQFPPENKKTLIIADFSLENQSGIKHWLQTKELHTSESSCIIKRVLSHDGRSKAFINGQPTTLSQLKELGEQLVDIQGQHSQHALLKPSYQLNLLDQYCQHQSLLQDVKTAFHQYKALQHNLVQLQQSQQQRSSLKELLSYQVDELDQFDFSENETNNLESEHKRLANAQQLQTTSLLAVDKLRGNESMNINQQLEQVCRDLESLVSMDPSVKPIVDQLLSISIDLQDSSAELNSYAEALELNPQVFEELDKRLTQWLDLSRKHQIDPHRLVQHHQQLKQQLKNIYQEDNDLESLNQELLEAQNHYQSIATKLSRSRQQKAKKLEAQVLKQLKALAMTHASIQFCFEDLKDNPSELGLEKVSIQFQPNPGHSPQALSKIASGGELSRVSLAIQVITIAQSNLNSMVFDEVDVGIGGGTAEVVGRLLKQLSKSAQVICITHQPQVAAQGDQHLLVSKFQHNNATSTQLKALDDNERILEVARMLGGINITETTLDHAKEMVEMC